MRFSRVGFNSHFPDASGSGLSDNRIFIPACCSGSNAAFEAESGGSIPSVGANFNQGVGR